MCILRAGVIAVALAIAAIWLAPTATAAPGQWFWVCHQQGNGKPRLIVVGDGAADAHLAHGDIVISAELPAPRCE